MRFINKTKSTLNREIKSIAMKSTIKRLEKQGIDYKDLSSSEFNSLLRDEIALLKSDTKKVGAGVGIGLVISMLTGI